MSPMSSTRKPPVPNPAHVRTVAILHEKGYRLKDEFKRARIAGLTIPESHFEVWVGAKGVIILQVWKDGNGSTTYANWPLGTTFDALSAALDPAPKQAKLFALIIDNGDGLHQSIHASRDAANHELFCYVRDQWRASDGPLPLNEIDAVEAYYGEGGRAEKDSERAEISECEIEA